MNKPTKTEHFNICTYSVHFCEDDESLERTTADGKNTFSDNKVCMAYKS